MTKIKKLLTEQDNKEVNNSFRKKDNRIKGNLIKPRKEEVERIINGSPNGNNLQTVCINIEPTK